MLPTLLLLACTASPAPDSADDTAPPTDDTGASPSSPLTLLSLNLHCFKLDGTAYTSTADRFAAIATTAADHDVDAIAVQEACVSATHGDAMALLADALQNTTGQTWGTAWTSTHLAWEGTEDEADEGVGLLARDTVLDDEVLDYAVQGTLYRRAISADIGPITVLSTHLDQEDADARRMQARQSAVAALVVRSDQAVVLAGDLNARVGSEPLADLAAAGFARLSEPADVDATLIDHVLAPAGAVVATDAALLFDSSSSAVSDHPGVLVTLETGTPTATATRLVAEADAGWGHYLAVRGDTAPLDWELGWPAISTGDARWEAVFQGWEDAVAYKWLLDDQAWETGEDRIVEPDQESVGSPSF